MSFPKITYMLFLFIVRWMKKCITRIRGFVPSFPMKKISDGRLLAAIDGDTKIFLFSDEMQDEEILIKKKGTDSGTMSLVTKASRTFQVWEVLVRYYKNKAKSNKANAAQKKQKNKNTKGE